jgi:hypothetical protein
VSAYAEGTSVAPDRSRAEIEKTLDRFGADEFAYASSKGRAVIAFTAQGRQVRIDVPMPDPSAREFIVTETGRARTATAARAAYDQEVRRRWRALTLVVKAKLEAVESGISTFEEEFLAHTVLPGGRTVAQEVMPAIDQAYLTGSIAPILQIEAGDPS